MSFKSFLKGVGRKVSSGTKKFASKAGSAVKSAVTVGTTGLKNLYNPETISSAIQGYSQGGVAGAVANASVTALGATMSELDKSGEYNPDYAYKKYGFPSNEEYQTALSYGYSDYNDWKTVKDLLGSNVTTTQVVTPASDVSKTSVDSSGNIVVKSGNSVEKTDKSSGVGGLVLGGLALKVMGVI